MAFTLLSDTPGFDRGVENQDGEIYRADISTAGAAHQMDISGSTSLRVIIAPRETVDHEAWFTLGYQPDSLR